MGECYYSQYLFLKLYYFFQSVFVIVCPYDIAIMEIEISKTVIKCKMTYFAENLRDFRELFSNVIYMIFPNQLLINDDSNDDF